MVRHRRIVVIVGLVGIAIILSAILFRASHPSSPRRNASSIEKMEIEQFQRPEQQKGADLSDEERFLIEGSVVDVSGAPVEAAVLMVTIGNYCRSARSGNDGEFRVVVPNSGTVLISCSPPFPTNIEVIEKVALSRQSPIARVRMILPSTADLKGRILKPNRQSASGVTVRLFSPFACKTNTADGYVLSRSFETTTDTEGNFVFTRLKPCCSDSSARQPYDSSEYSLLIRPIGARSTTRSIHVLPGSNVLDDTILEEELPPARIEGVVADRSGRPISGASLTLFHVHKNYDESRLLYSTSSTFSEKGGSFTIEVSFPGDSSSAHLWDQVLYVLAGDYAETALPLSIKPGQQYRDIKIQLDLGGRISARVVDEQGKPLPKIRVLIYNEQVEYFPAETLETDGEGRIDWRQGGKYSYGIWCEFARESDGKSESVKSALEGVHPDSAERVIVLKTPERLKK